MPSRAVGLYLQVWNRLARRLGTLGRNATSMGADETGFADPDCDWGGAKSAHISAGSASEEECSRLRLRAGEEVYRIRRLVHHRGQVTLIEDSTLPAALFPGLADQPAIAQPIGDLARNYGIVLCKVEERISMRIPPAGIADLLGVPSGTSVMVCDRLVFALDGDRPVEWRLVHCNVGSMPAG